MDNIWKVRSLVVAMAPLLICGAKNSHAEFSLNFLPQTGTAMVASIANIDCFSGVAGGMPGMGGGGMMGMGACGADPTPFLNQVVVDAAGVQYYHTIVGDPARGSNFAQDVYVRTVAGAVCWFGCATPRYVQGGGMGGGGGGMMGMGNGPAPLSASAGSDQNEVSPLSSVETVSGSGTGNPTQAHIRQINNETGFTQEFLKARDAFKPKITQTVTTPQITSTFSVDMSAIGYSTNTAVAPMINTVVLTNTGVSGPPPGGFTSPGIPPGTTAGNFNMADFAATSKATAGKYTYTAGTSDGGSFGTYTYVDGVGFNVYGADWGSLCDPAQNPTSTCVTFGRVGGMGMPGGGGFPGPVPPPPPPGGGGGGGGMPPPGGGGAGGGGGMPPGGGGGGGGM